MSDICLQVEMICKVLSSSTAFDCVNIPPSNTIMTRKTRKRLTRRRISPMQKKAQVMVTDKTEAKTGETGPQSILTVTNKL